MRTDQDIIATLCRMAEDVLPIRSAKLAAAITLRGEIIAFGTNRMHSHPFQAKFGKNDCSSFWHAETNAIFNALRRVEKEKLSRASIFVARVKYDAPRKKQFIQGLAAPCEGCKKCIAEYGLKRLIYTSESGLVSEQY